AILLIAVRSGAVEACWAHKPEVYGSKPRSASKHSFISDHELYSPINVHVYKKISIEIRSADQRGAVEACWAHNSVDRSHAMLVKQF
ncbi:hypothetical protein CDAR_402321, partial [Caerostris darwini]